MRYMGDVTYRLDRCDGAAGSMLEMKAFSGVLAGFPLRPALFVLSWVVSMVA